MPQTNVEELTSRLLAALDSQGHVKDMVAINDVVAQLERMQITAEHLKATRLGKHINSIRRQLTDANKSLAKRMKCLVKSWQQLLQARPPNGLPPTATHTISSHSSPLVAPMVSPSPSKREQLTSSPVKHDSSVLTITSSSPQSVKELFLGGGEASLNGAATSGEQQLSDPAKNRKKLLKLLSKVKKPLSQPTSGAAVNSATSPSTTAVETLAPVTAAVETLAPVTVAVETLTPVTTAVATSGPVLPFEGISQPSDRFSSKNFVPVEENGSALNGGKTSRRVSPPVGPPGRDNLSLRVCLQRDSIPRTPQTSRKTLHKKRKRLKHEPLIVSLPKNLIRLKLPQLPPVLVDSKPLPIEKLVVSIPIEHMTQKHSHYGKKSRQHLERSTEFARSDTTSRWVSSTKHAQTVNPTEHAQTVNSTEHAQTVNSTEHAQTVNSTEHAQTVNSTENAQTVSSTKHAQTVSSTKHTQTLTNASLAESTKTVELSEPAQRANCTKHTHLPSTSGYAQMVNSSDNTGVFGNKETEQEPVSMEVDEMSVKSHPPSILPRSNERGGDERLMDQMSADERLHTSVDHVTSGGETVILLPYVYIDGVTDSTS